MSRVAVIQRPPVFLNKAETIGFAVSSVREAAAAGARLVVFPEAFIPGYPAWIWRLRPGADMNLSERLHSRLLAEAVRIGAGDLAALCDAAPEHEVSVVCGVDERDTAARFMRRASTCTSHRPTTRPALARDDAAHRE